MFGEEATDSNTWGKWTVEIYPEYTFSFNHTKASDVTIEQNAKVSDFQK